MSLLDSIKNSAKSLVVGDVEVPDPVVPIKPSATPYVPSAYSIPSISSLSSPAVDTTEIDKAIKAKFDAALATNTPPLYIEFNDTVNTLAEDIPSVPSRYKAAIKMLTKHGANITAIISAFDACIQIVEKSAQDFNASVAKKIEEKIGGRQNQIQDYDKNIELTNGQIQSLQEQVASMKQKKEEIAAELIKEDAAIKLKQSRLEIVYNQVHSDLDRQKQALIDYSK